DPRRQARPRDPRHHAVGLGDPGAAERGCGVRRCRVELRRLLRQEAVDGGVDGRAGAARDGPPRGAVMADIDLLQCAERALALMQAAGFEAARAEASVQRGTELNVAHNEPSLWRST